MSQKITFINNSLERAVQALEFLAANTRPSGGNQQFNSEDLYQIARELKISVDNTQEKWYIDRMKEEIEMARQYLEKEKNGTLDLENLSEGEKQMRIFSEAYDKSGLADIVDSQGKELREC